MINDSSYRDSDSHPASRSMRAHPQATPAEAAGHREDAQPEAGASIHARTSNGGPIERSGEHILAAPGPEPNMRWPEKRAGVVERQTTRTTKQKKKGRTSGCAS